jgi:hypothetical protein
MYAQPDDSRKSCCCCTPSPEQIIAKDRDFVKNKWSLPDITNKSSIDTSGLMIF